jgi:hypothetical protein
MLRTVFAFLVGAVVMAGCVAALQALGHAIWPPAANLHSANPQALAEFVAQMPLAAKLWVLVAYAIAVEVGTLIAVLIHRPRWRGLAMALGLLMTALCAINFWMLPHPWWMVIAGLLIPLPIAMTAGWWMRPKSA